MKKKLLAPAITIAVGLAWLLNTLNIIAGVDWLWSIGLLAAGIFNIAAGGLNKVSIVTGPFLVIASIFSVMRQTGRIAIDLEIPILIIVLGVLMFISQLSKLEVPGIFQKEEEE
jgi:hypothetical protein